MKRISLLIIGLLAIVVTTLQAQVDFGVRFGVSYSALTQRIDEGYVSGGKAGFSIAGLADIPIYKVSDYPDMYVVRPAYMMTFLNMI